MVDTPSKDAKRKLKTPTPFSGKREDLRKFLQEIKIYLMANSDAYPDDLDKILFVLSYMSEGDANSWKEEFFDTAEQTAAQNNATILYQFGQFGRACYVLHSCRNENFGISQK